MDFVKKYLVAICNAVCVILLFLPFCSASVEAMGMKVASVSANALQTSFFGYLMLVVSAFIIAMCFVPNVFDKVKGMLSVLLPLACVVLAILALLLNSVDVSAYGGMVEASVGPAIGFFLVIIANLGAAVAAAVSYYGLSFSKGGFGAFLNKFKADFKK